MQNTNRWLKSKQLGFIILLLTTMLSACGGSNNSDNGNEKPEPTPKPKPKPGEPVLGSPRLNDTGITWGVSNGQKSENCAAEHSQQDCAHGRDSNKALNKDDNGYKGFNFTKLDATGKALKADATSWACVRDNVTKMVWEVKTDDGGTHDKKWTYYFYDSKYKDSNDSNGNGGDDNAHPGADSTTSQANASATCGLSDCTTEAFVSKVNTDGLCGINKWELPSMQALLSLVDFGRTKQKEVGGVMQDYTGLIDERYFPNFISSWSSTLAGETTGYAYDKATRNIAKKNRNNTSKLSVRLVHIPTVK